ncbi:MAG: helix-turn-helix transcriptional regulator [Alphaproteobacteria bacterium]|nr:helix-turn-helix transcriptional regulator [Alphaproteobacteria bacterium]MBT5389482.1 helix-turn-helix transcriptional regulator [Alphaproteobacteria bacterium]
MSIVENRSAYEFNIRVVPVVSNIAEPLSQLGIEHFCYARFFQDGTILRVSNNKGWTDKFFENEFFNDKALFERQIKQVDEGEFYKFIVSGAPQGRHLSQLYDFGFWNTLHMYQRLHDSVEIFVFTGTPDNSGILNSFLNEGSIYRKFIFHFKDKCHEIISPEKGKLITKSAIDISFSDKAAKGLLREEFNINRFYLTNGSYLTKQEMKCVKHLLRGKTNKEIANVLDLSSRTVEGYIETLKERHECATKSQLVQKLFQFKDLIG